MLQGTTLSWSAGAPSSRLRLFHPPLVNILTHCGFYKYLMNMVSTIIYSHAPLNRSVLSQPLRPKTRQPSSVFTRSKQRICCWEKATGAAKSYALLLLELVWKLRFGVQIPERLTQRKFDSAMCPL